MRTHDSARAIPCNAGNARRTRLSTSIIVVVLSLYSVVTVAPFYFLFVRSFVPTRESNRLHLWIPELPEFDMNADIGNLSVYYNLDLKQFKDYMGITGYLDPRSTINEVAEYYNIPKDKLKRYLEPFYLFNGWYIVIRGWNFMRSMAATIWVVGASLLIGSLLGLATGSVLGGFRKRWHMRMYNLYMLQIIIPPAMIMLPLYFIVAKVLPLYNTYLALILLNAQGGALSAMIFTSHVAGVPRELWESVQIDGGSRWRYYGEILLPLSKTAIATYVAISLPLFWNNLLNGYLFLSQEKFTLVPMVNALNGIYTTNFQAVFSGLLISMLPLLLVYLAFQRLFVRSFLAGAIKG